MSKNIRHQRLKTDPEVFQDVIDGLKNYEIRFDDRGFEIGDILDLVETRHAGEEMRKDGQPLILTGRGIQKEVKHILRGYGLKKDWVILSV